LRGQVYSWLLIIVEGSWKKGHRLTLDIDRARRLVFLVKREVLGA
jgi:hypothetical protein